MLFGAIYPDIQLSRIRVRTGNAAAALVAMVARITQPLLLVDISAHVFCLYGCGMYLHDAKRVYGMHVARPDDGQD